MLHKKLSKTLNDHIIALFYTQNMTKGQKRNDFNCKCNKACLPYT